MAKYAPEPRKYELMIVVAPTVGDDGLPAVVERVSGYITEKGGEIESVNHDNPWGRRRLAYQINNFQDAFYVLYYFTTEPRTIDEIERDIRLDDVIIRHLLVKYDPLTERVSKPPRAGREDRPVPGGPTRTARATTEQAPAEGEAATETPAATSEPEAEAPAAAEEAATEQSS